MGSKSPEGHQQVPNGGSNNNDIPISNADGRKPRTASGTHGLEGGGVNEGADTDDDDDDDVNPRRGLNETVANESKSQKKNKARKRARNKKKQNHISQTSPPTVLISRLYPDKYPEGELVPYDNTQRTSKTEVRFDSDKWDQDFLQDYRHAAEIHRQVRQYAQKQLIKPGVTLASIADGIEDGVRALCGHAGLETGDCLKAGLAFPTGLCLNNIAAHWTPNPGAKHVTLQEKDVLKVDFGVHVNGRIVDSAFTVRFDPTFDSLSDAVRAATNAGIKAAGVDVRISDVSADIQETMESYEVEIDGKIHPVKAVRNLTGHDILRYQIHGGKQIPFTRNNSRDKMEEGEVFAIETFGTTGRSGYLHDDIGVYGYNRNRLANTSNITSPSAQSLLKTIDANFTTLPFSRRYLERLGVTKYHLGMKHLIDSGVVECYAPLVDQKGTFTAQWEHTILLHEGGKEVISRGEDY